MRRTLARRAVLRGRTLQILLVTLALATGLLVRTWRISEGVAAAPSAQITPSPTSGPAGSLVTVYGKGFAAGEPVQLTWNGSAAGMPSVRTAQSKSFVASVLVPRVSAGSSTIGARGAYNSATATFQVNPGGQLVTATPPATATASVTATVQPTATPTATSTATPTFTPQPTTTPSPTPTSTPASGQIYLGVWQPGVPTNMAALDRFEQQAGRRAAIVMFWRDWNPACAGALDTTWLTNIAARGSVPLISWLPENWCGGNAPYGLSAIAAGQYDSYLTGWAQQLAAYRGPVLIRWAHEMNGTWYPWSGDPTAYKAAWQHIVTLFRQVGATNVRWVWAPNAWWSGDTSVADARPYFPGDATVDWVGLDAYTSRAWSSAPASFSFMFGNAYSLLTPITTRPLMVAEYAAGEWGDGGTLKAGWIRQSLTTDISAFPRIQALVWFNEDKTVAENPAFSWPVETDALAQQAYHDAIASTRYLSQWQ